MAGDPVSPMDLAKDAFDPDGGNDDPGPCLPKKTHCILVTTHQSSLCSLDLVSYSIFYNFG